MPDFSGENDTSGGDLLMRYYLPAEARKGQKYEHYDESAYHFLKDLEQK